MECQEATMSLLGSVIGAALGGGSQGGGGGNAALLNAVIGMLGQGGGGGGGGLGGLGGLVSKMQQGGLGDVVGSWVGTGQNLPVQPEQLGNALGQDTISSMAGQLGMNNNDLLGQLSQMLPQVVDKLTPQGQVPQGDLSSVLGGLLGGGQGGQAGGGMGDLAGMLGSLLNKR
jgi:uncharacterized protein YidB (DUF937 family)